MINCKYTIDAKTFTSESELNNYLANNYLNIKFSKYSLQQEKVKNKIDEEASKITFSDVEVINERGFFEKTHTYIRNSDKKELTSSTKLIKDNAFVQPFNSDNYIVNSYNAATGEKLSIEQIKEVALDKNEKEEPTKKAKVANKYLTEVANWTLESELGSKIHKIYENYLNTKTIDPLDTGMNLGQAKAMVKAINKIIDIEDGIVMSEVIVHSGDYAGMIDILIIRPNGKVDVYDLKTSKKSRTLWSADKNLSIEYQQNIYKKILNSYGITVNSLNIIPIKIEEIAYESTKALAENVVVQDSYEVNKKNYGIEKVLEGFFKDIKISTIEKFYENDPNIDDFTRTLFDYEPNEVEEGVKNAIATNIRNIYTNTLQKNPKATYIVYRNTTIRLIKNKELIPIEEIIEEVIKSYTVDKSKAIDELFSQIKDIQSGKSKNDIEDLSFLGGDAKSPQVRNLKTMLKYYANGNYDLLISNERLIFKNKITKDIDIVQFSLQSLSKSINNSKNLFNNFISDLELKRAAIKPVDNIYKEAEIYRMGSFLSQDKNIAFLVNNGSKVRRTSFFSYADASSNTFILEMIDLDTIVNRMSYLYKEAISESLGDDIKKYEVDKLISVIKDSKIEFGKSYKDLLQYIVEEQISGHSRQAEFILKEFLTKKNLLLKLGRRLKTLESKKQNLTNLENKELELLPLVILELKGINLSLEDDIQAGLLSKDIKNVNDFTNKVINQFRELTDQVLRNFSTRYMQVADSMYSVFDSYYDSKGLTRLKRLTIGLTNSTLEQVIERDFDKGIFRLKHPKSLKGEEKELVLKLQSLLKNHYARLIHNEDDFQALSDNTNGFLDIPLMRETSVTKWSGTADKVSKGEFSIQSFREDLVKDYQDILNYAGKFGRFDPDEKHWEMYNRFSNYNGDYEQRLQFMQEEGNNIETNLEIIFHSFVLNSIKVEEYNDAIIPFNALKSALNIYRMFTNSKLLVNVEDFLTDYLNKNFLERNSSKVFISKDLDKVLVAVSSLASKLMIGGNFKSALNSMTSNVLKVVIDITKNKAYKEYAFNRGEFLEALQYVTFSSDVFSTRDVTIVAQMNDMYQISDRDPINLFKRFSSSNKNLFTSDWLYWLNSKPDYMIRMAIQVAQMMKDGSFKAHELVEGKLVYDEKKDLRFWNKDGSQTEEQKAMRGLYAEELSQERGGLNPNGSFARAYSIADSRANKDFSNMVLGSYTPDTQTQAEATLAGSTIHKMKTWTFAILSSYYNETVYEEDNLVTYVKMTTDDEGNKKAIRTGKFEEGIWQSLVYLVQEVREARGLSLEQWNNLNPQRKANLKKAAYDLVLAALFYWLFSELFKQLLGMNKKEQKKNVFTNTILSALSDTSPLVITDAYFNRNPLAVLNYTYQFTSSMYKDIINTPELFKEKGDFKLKTPEKIGIYRTGKSIYESVDYMRKTIVGESN